MKFLKRLYVKLWLIPLYTYSLMTLVTGKKAFDPDYELARRFFNYKLYILKKI